MDFDFVDSAPETQLDWMALLNQVDAPLNFSSQPSPPTPTDSNQAMVPLAPEPDAAQSVEAMKEMIYCLAALQPVRIDPELVKPRPRRNVRISKDPQSVAARQRRERIGERIRILQQLVPGGSRMDTASMLEEAVRYLKFLKAKVRAMERAAAENAGGSFGGGLNSHAVHQVSGGQGFLNAARMLS